MFNAGGRILWYIEGEMVMDRGNTKQEILEALFEGMEIHSSEIAAILKKHGVCGDVEALQDSGRNCVGLEANQSAVDIKKNGFYHDTIKPFPIGFA